jgi:hypothetical protein
MINPLQINNGAGLMAWMGGLACDAVLAVTGWLANGLPLTIANFSLVAIEYPVRAGTLRRLRVFVASNTSITATTVVLTISGAPTVLTVLVGAGLTGVFNDFVNTVPTIEGNQLGCQVVSAAGGGAVAGLTLFVTCELV